MTARTLRVASVFIFVLTALTDRVGGQFELSRVAYDFTPGRVFGYVMVMDATVGEKTEYLGGVVLFQVMGKEGSRHRLHVKDNLRVVHNPDELKPQLPRGSSAFAANSATVNRVHGLRPTADGDLPTMLGDTLEWFFPPLPQKLAKRITRRGMSRERARSGGQAISTTIRKQ